MCRPDWIDDSLYPFPGQTFESEDGAMQYVDAGSGHPVLLVHGTPTWSFLYRSTIREFTDEYRVIAPDHLGFGLSEKPLDGSYRVTDHARRLRAFVDYLGIAEFTLVVHDFGGPIGLPYAIAHPETVDRLVLCNTWLWPLRGDRRVRLAHLVARGMLGRLFYRRYNGSARFLVPAGWGDARPLSEEVHRHYTAPFATPESRVAPWHLARELVDAADWYDAWWDQRSALGDMPCLLLWGMADPTFGPSYLRRWQRQLPDARVVTFPDVGHFVPDEAGNRVSDEIRAFLP